MARGESDGKDAARGADLSSQPLLVDHVAPSSAPQETHVSLEADVLYEVEPQCVGLKATATQSCLNIVSTIVGAGTMALPMGFAVLGLAGGILSLLFVTWIMSNSIGILVEVSWEQNLSTYGGLVEHYMGQTGGLLVRMSLVFTCLGFLLSYLIITGDLLTGTAPDYTGLLPSLTGHVGGPIPWYISRAAAVAVASTVAIFPLTCLRSLERLSVASLLKCLVTFFFCAITIWACIKGNLNTEFAKVRWWPDFEAFQEHGVGAIVQFVAVVPVVLTAYSCHFNIHPTMQELEQFTPWRMSLVANNALAISSAIFLSVGVAGFLSFGDGVKADVLQNYNMIFLQPLFGERLGMAVDYSLKVGYFVLLLCTYPLLNWPFRENILEIAGVNPSGLENTRFCAISFALNAAVYAMAMGIPSIWTALSLMGSTSAVMVIFVFPGLVQYLSAVDRLDLPTAEPSRSRRLASRRAYGVLLVLLGVGVGAAGVYSILVGPL
mmetsp:Transcript_11926/g.33588  ORF Transcript_11926/g.33588 Transcript_11926/m.33588 type:complete len:492 (+) Transcript_11926:177-1652(+)